MKAASAIRRTPAATAIPIPAAVPAETYPAGIGVEVGIEVETIVVGGSANAPETVLVAEDDCEVIALELELLGEKLKPLTGMAYTIAVVDVSVPVVTTSLGALGLTRYVTVCWASMVDMHCNGKDPGLFGCASLNVYALHAGCVSKATCTLDLQLDEKGKANPRRTTERL
jgi:hypothetical protein